MPNSIDFYKGIFLHVTPICIIVPCNKTLISDSSLNTDYLKNRITELGNHLSEKNAVINYLEMQLIPKSQDKKYVVATTITTIKIRLIKMKIVTPNWK